MELGEKLKQARLEAGLSQRQLCGDAITRNMLSQIENGGAKPSMGTLRYLAERLGKSVSWFLEEDAVTSPNQEIMSRAREAWATGDWDAVEKWLSRFREPDPVFEMEYRLLKTLHTLETAEKALEAGKIPYCVRILEENGPIRGGYCSEELERRRLLLLARAKPGSAGHMLPSLDEELLVRAGVALEQGDPDGCIRLLEAARDRENCRWNYLRGECAFIRGDYAWAAVCYRKAEAGFPDKVLARLEVCCRELGDYEGAYRCACALRDQKGEGIWSDGTII